ncbi:MAG: shikimate dehydrogenase [Acidobacteriota bacterium]|nr:shikimate dehydrogenase [Acidobacteriota bacterium]
MNNGKICVSVCAETADEFNKQIERAEPLADFIELRFDCLKPDEMEKAAPSFRENYISTFRPKEQGGRREISLAEREDFWNSGNDFGGGDFEEDVVENHLYWLYHPVICSYHDFNGVPENLPEIYERIKNIPANIDVIKIAAHAEDITDTIAVWKLLERANAERESVKIKKLEQHKEFEKKLKTPLPAPEPFLEIIPIAMGEAGKWTRILGLAHGAFMTYAALETGSETAPGQISARDLIEVYRVKELNEETEIYGIVGGNTSYSMSPYIHNAAFKFHNLNAVFVPLQVKDLDGFMRRMVKTETREIELNFRGFAVTIPHKQNIVKHLDFIDETAREIGAVNTVKIDADGKFSGYNTDAPGFLEPLQNSLGDLQNAKIAVIGAGGASRAVCYALKKAGADVTVFARNPAKAEQLKADFGVQIEELSTAKSYRDFDVLVNATPLGTKGETENETPASASQIENVKLVYDLIYNPSETKLIKEAKKASVPTLGGLSMLVAQAAAQQKIWTSTDAPAKEMSATVLRRLAAK